MESRRSVSRIPRLRDDHNRRFCLFLTDSLGRGRGAGGAMSWGLVRSTGYGRIHSSALLAKRRLVECSFLEQGVRLKSVESRRADIARERVNCANRLY